MQDIAYCSDKYQYTMGHSFFQAGMQHKRAVFNLFFRQAPDNNNWAVVSGIREAVEMILGLGGRPESFFERFLPGEPYAPFRKYLAGMRFTGDVYAMREGEIAFPKQPVLTVSAPLIEAQVLETPLLCILNHQMAVATKASRVTRSTDKPVSEFGSRRAHGPWAAVYGAKAACIGGCANSSNILAGIRFGFRSSGTMAHSYVNSFGCSVHGEYEAFENYIRTHRGETLILLVDTYDTLKCGIRNAVKAFRNNGIGNGYAPGFGIRLDSGDLAYLSSRCREELDRAGLQECRIIATNSLDEYLIADLERQHAAIDAYGVGDAIATSKHNPCFGNVYKLVEIDGRPVLKRSEDRGKLINPGFQATYRIIRNGSFQADVTCLRGDRLARQIEQGETILLRDENDFSRQTRFEGGTYTARLLQEPVLLNGRPAGELPDLEASRRYYRENLAALNPTQRRLLNPHLYKNDISDDLFDLKSSLTGRILQEIEAYDRTENR